jgi:hypothetical protein
MANKVGSRFTAGVLAALTLGALLPAAVGAQNYNAVSPNFIPGTTYSGGGRGGGAMSGNYWWYGGGMGGGAGYGGGGAGPFNNPSQLLYPTADGPQPSTTPVPSYQTEMMDDLATQSKTIHTDGPSMSLNTNDIHMPKVSSYFQGFYQDMQAGAQYGRRWAPQQQTAMQPPSGDDAGSVGAAFQRPQVQSRLSSGDFRAHARTLSGTSISVRSDLKPKMQEAEQLFSDLKASGKLGTFDMDPLEQQITDLRRRVHEVDNIQSDVEQRAEEGKLLNDIDNFEYQLRQHNE